MLLYSPIKNSVGELCVDIFYLFFLIVFLTNNEAELNFHCFVSQFPFANTPKLCQFG